MWRQNGDGGGALFGVAEGEGVVHGWVGAAAAAHLNRAGV